MPASTRWQIIKLPCTFFYSVLFFFGALRGGCFPQYRLHAWGRRLMMLFNQEASTAHNSHTAWLASGLMAHWSTALQSIIYSLRPSRRVNGSHLQLFTFYLALNRRLLPGMIPRSAFDFRPGKGLHLLSATHSVYFNGESEGDLAKNWERGPEGRMNYKKGKSRRVYYNTLQPWPSRRKGKGLLVKKVRGTATQSKQNQGG